MGLEKPVHLMSTDIPQGQFHAKQLSADTLYKVFMQRLDISPPRSSGSAPALSAVLSNDISIRGLGGEVCPKVVEDSVVNADETAKDDKRMITSLRGPDKPSSINRQCRKGKQQAN